MHMLQNIIHKFFNFKFFKRKVVKTMDKSFDMNGFGGYPPFGPFDPNIDPNMNENPMFNPVMQYEQAYMYYRYLTQQVEYKIKCKEYEKLCSNRNENSRDRKIE